MGGDICLAAGQCRTGDTWPPPGLLARSLVAQEPGAQLITESRPLPGPSRDKLLTTALSVSGELGNCGNSRKIFVGCSI